MATGPLGDRQSIINSQQIILSRFTVRPKKTSGTGSSQGNNNSDSVSLSEDALLAARLRDQERIKEQQTDRKEINTYKPGGNKSAANITGDGNNNTLTGGSGNDTIDGLAGADKLIGKGGSDTYIVDNIGDVVVEGVLAGNDTVKASIDYSLGVNVENLTLTGTGDLDGTGNSSKNTIIGNFGNNTLDGGAGADILKGGVGNDTYIVDNAGDLVIELSGEGTDTVNTSLSYSLGANIENLTLTGAGNVDGTGNTLSNTITGNDGNNTLDGGIGADSLAGGIGNDTYVVDNFGDVVTELAGQGTDTVNASVSYTLGADIENLTLTGSDNIDGKGNNLSNTIAGNDGNNTLDGGAGIDTLIGGKGDDTYVVDALGDVVTELSGEGTDTVNAAISYTLLGANIENLTLTGSGNINGTGSDDANTITGNSGNNTLDGGKGADSLAGGLGNDTYIVDDVNDVVFEASGNGNDTVNSSVDYTIFSSIENLNLTGTGDISGTGNSNNNTITGNTGNNYLDGGAGDDTLSGGAGDDTLKGGAGIDKLIGGIGNDTYIVDDTSDVIQELVGEGIDIVASSATYTLADNFENLTLTGTANINGIGNTGDNTITGNDGNNKLSGGGGNDILIGGGGIDTLEGGTGDDTYVVDNLSDIIVELADAGTDTINSSIDYTLGANVENLVLTGAGNLEGTGNDSNNTITGNTGNNTLTGGLGTDTLKGGLGDDTYVIKASGDSADVIQELSGEGTDTVESFINYTLGADIENLTLAGSANLKGTGNILGNVITGNDGQNTLDGAAGNDTLIGGDGNDTLIGGADNDYLDGGNDIDTLEGGTGNDTYVVDNVFDVVIESSGEGTDTVETDITYSLLNNLENLTLTGTGNLDGTGNSLENIITGNSGSNTLDGGAGNDSLFGGSGTDKLIGGADNDYLDGGSGADSLDGGTGNDIYVVDNVGDNVTDSSGTDEVRASISYSIAADIENLTLTGTGNLTATGNTGDNIIKGNTGDNTLDGGAGADKLIGGTGNDTYVVDNAGDVVTELAGQGTDTVNASINYSLGADIENLTLTGAAISGTGNADNNTITGNAGNNTLDGGLGADTLDGGLGDDTYTVDNIGDVVTESAGQGTDTINSSVTYTLTSANIENLNLTGSGNISGTGNALSNTIIGNTGNNTLDGGLGADSLDGGAGNDTYIIDNIGDVITDSSGLDTVNASVTYILAANLENLTLTGAASINGTGNTGDNTITGNTGNNTLDGGAGNDYLDGGAGNDKLIGGIGNDTYVVDNISDVVTELTGEGTDTVNASVTYSLAANLENLTLTGAASINGTGNADNNTITGNTGNNTLDGGAGADSLAGGAGNDTYVVDDAGDIVTELADEGTDTVNASINYSIGAKIENLTLTGTANLNGTGSADNNTITGNTGNNTLDGGAGADLLAGGAGNDTYIVDNAGDVTTEVAGAGTDTVNASISYSLAANVENLTLTGTGDINGTGNADNNTITGNTGNNTLDGGAGADLLTGGAGNDTYIVDNAGDVATELLGEGTDTVNASISYSLGANVENLTLTGAGNINGTGNADNNTITGNTGNNTLDGGDGNDSLLGGAGIDKLTGGTGNDYLDGGTGADSLIGGTGNDTYVVNDAGDIVTELADEGTDTINASVSYSLGADIENLTLTGAAISGTGNSEDNIIIGNTGNNTLDGGSGNDYLDGGTGDDTLIGGAGNNTILGGSGTDTLNLSGAYEDYTISYDSGTQTYTLTNTGIGETQVVTGVENFNFNGTTKVDNNGVLEDL